MQMGSGQLARMITMHVSCAVVLFALLQIGGVVWLSGRPGAQVAPFIALGLLIILAIPFARRLESRWTFLSARALPCPGLVKRFRRDRNRLWFMTLLVPMAWVGGLALAGQYLFNS